MHADQMKGCLGHIFASLQATGERQKQSVVQPRYIWQADSQNLCENVSNMDVLCELSNLCC